MIHSMKYKDVRRSGYDGKKVVLIGIGNSAVDIADNLVAKGGYVCLMSVCPRIRGHHKSRFYELKIRIL